VRLLAFLFAIDAPSPLTRMFDTPPPRPPQDDEYDALIREIDVVGGAEAITLDAAYRA